MSISIVEWGLGDGTISLRIRNVNFTASQALFASYMFDVEDDLQLLRK